MRLFTALWPSEEAARHLAEAVDRVRSTPELAEATGGTRGFRFVPPQRWHLTLCFHGDDADQQWLSDRLDRRLTRLGRQDAEFGPPRLRLAGVGTFRGVLWVGVEPAEERDSAVLRALVRAAGANPHGYRGHVTVARWSAGRPDRVALSDLFSGYAGPWWDAAEVGLVASVHESGQPVYRTVHSVPVGTAA